MKNLIISTFLGALLLFMLSSIQSCGARARTPDVGDAEHFVETHCKIVFYDKENPVDLKKSEFIVIGDQEAAKKEGFRSIDYAAECGELKFPNKKITKSKRVYIKSGVFALIPLDDYIRHQWHSWERDW